MDPVDAVEKVDLTLERKAGKIPCSGSSANGLGNVVRPVIGDGRFEPTDGARPAVSNVSCESDMAKTVVAPCTVFG
jgi:hypothetical protein